MRVLVAGSHGQVGHYATRIAAQRHYDVRGMVRDEAQTSDVEALGAEAVVADLTEDVDRAVRGCDAVAFAAGSGGEDVWGVDRDGAINIIESAESLDVDRFVMLSSINADTPARSPEPLREYLRAKAEADERLRESELTYTIVRPTTLDDPGTGRIRTAADIERGGEVPREDVAESLVAAIGEEGTYGTSFDLAGGDERRSPEPPPPVVFAFLVQLRREAPELQWGENREHQQVGPIKRLPALDCENSSTPDSGNPPRLRCKVQRGRVWLPSVGIRPTRRSTGHGFSTRENPPGIHPSLGPSPCQGHTYP